MAEVTVRYVGAVHGHPEAGSEVTVERTAMVDGLLAAGLAVEVEPENVANNIPEKVTSDGE